jgi:HTH-type transcriptional regulator / antitoxin HigA
MADIHPIRDEADYEQALAEISALLTQNPVLFTPAGERLELLSLVVSDYEEKHYPILPPDDPLAVIEFYMDKDGLTRKDLEQYLGGKARVSDVLNRRRSLSLAMIRRLSQGLGIPADLLIGPGKRVVRRPSTGAQTDPQP